MKRQKLITLRKSSKLSQATVAAYLNMDATCYCRIENGKTMLLEKVMLKLCRLYCCNLEDLIEDEKLACYHLSPMPDETSRSLDSIYKHIVKKQQEQEEQLKRMIAQFKERFAKAIDPVTRVIFLLFVPDITI